MKLCKAFLYSSGITRQSNGKECQNHDIMAVVAGVRWHVTRLGEAGIAPYL
jgi:hypothetical protein